MVAGHSISRPILNNLLTKKVKPKGLIKRLCGSVFGSDILSNDIADDHLFFDQGSLGIIQVKFNYNNISDGTIVLRIYLELQTGGRQIFYRYQAALSLFAVSKQNKRAG